MSTLRALFGLLVVAAIFYAGWKVAPTYYTNYQLEESMDDSARMGTANPLRSLDEIREEVLRNAAALGVELDPEQLKVERRGQDVYIWAEYNVHFDLSIYDFDVHFTPASKNKKRLM